MQTAFTKAIELILSCDAELIDILGVTARMSVMSSLLSLVLGVPLGIFLGMKRTKCRTVLTVLTRTLMGMPPVVCGLLFYLLFSGVGPFGGARLLFTLPLMVAAQVVLITPIIAGNLESYVKTIADPVRETARGMGLSKRKTFLLTVNECAYEIFSVYLLGFARSIAEVGAVAMVGGAIAWKTNVMTTAIMEYTNKGNFSKGIALGLILMAVSLLVNVVFSLLQRRVTK